VHLSANEDSVFHIYQQTTTVGSGKGNQFNSLLVSLKKKVQCTQYRYPVQEVRFISYSTYTSSPPHWKDFVIFDHRVDGSDNHSCENSFRNEVKSGH
jgi:hypothetical protein